MTDNSKTKVETLAELVRLRARIQELEPLESRTLQLEQELRRREQELRSLTDNVPEIIIRFDPALNPIYANQHVLEFFEASRENLLDQIQRSDRLPEHLVELWRRHLTDVFEHGRPITFEFELPLQDGVALCESRLIPELDDKGDAETVLSVTRNITEAKRIAESLRARQSELRAIFNRGGIGMVLVDLDGRFLRVNREFCKMLGFDEREMSRLTIADVTHEDDVETSMRRFHDLRSSGHKRLRIEKRYRHKNGEVRWGRTTVSLVMNADGVPRFAVGMIEDITEHRAAEDDRRLLEEQLRQSQKLEAVGQLAGGVAHDFNNLLTAIIGNAEVIAAQIRSSGPEVDVRPLVDAGLKQIERAGQRAASLTRQLLAFGRRQMTQPEVLDLNRIIGEMDELLQRLIGEHISLDVRVASDLSPIHADAGHIEQVIMNLVLNARDAMPAGGRLTIASANVASVPSGSGRHREVSAPHVMVSVSDTGTGMSEEILDRIYEPFFTTKPVGMGSGLGLATVYGIVTQAAGEITVESEPGRGSTFRVYFPAVETPVLARPTPAETDTSGREVILVSEDEELVRQVTCGILRSQGYTVLEARHGAEALSIAEEHGAQIDLLLTDVVMPDMNGQELARELTRRHGEIPLLFMSGYAAEFMGEHGIELDHGFLEKPFNPKTLLESVRQALEQRESKAI